MSWNQKDINDKEFFNKRKYEKLKEKIKNYESDTKQDTRYRSQKCKSCMYLDNDLVGFDQITISNCRICDSEIGNANSIVNKLCLKCAMEKFLCTKCGSNLD